jgi:trimeric autotransporter adhesin
MKKNTKIVIAVIELAALGAFALLPGAQAVVPPPDGGYPGFNTAEGQNALFSLTTGGGNTAVGAFSLFSVTEGSFNTATGAGALLFNTADQNTAMGAAALLSNTTGGTFAGTFGDFDVGPNTAIGALALGQNTTAGANTAVGYQALGNMTIGVGDSLGGYSTAVGFKALASADTSTGTGGHTNDAFGYEALAKATTGFQNVGIGAFTLFNNLAGAANVAVGHSALSNNTGNLNTALGYFAGADATTGSGNVYIGTNVEGSAGESDHTYIRNINTTTVSGGGTDTVTVNLSTGLLGHLSSSRRYKEDIQPMDKASETLFALKPVTFRYRKEIDQSQSLDYGLIAEEVAKVDPNLATRGKKGQIESVRYNAINAMLLNEFLKEHRKVVEQDRKIREQETTIVQLQSTVAKQGATVAHQQKQIEALTAGLQKVSAQIQISKTAPTVVRNNP